MVCVGCHSEDRILTIVDNELLKVYLGFIDNITEYRHDVIQLCWECKALLRKFQRFRDQVRHAYSIAVTCLVSQSKSLSNLRITECNSIIKVDHDSEVLPTTFVKIEVEPHADSADVFDDLGDGESVGDGLNDDLDDFVKLNDDKVDIKPDPILESEATSKSVKQNETTDTFNDSDDEPLKCDSTKPRGKRKRKIDDVPKGRPAKRPGVVNNAKVQNKLQRLNVDADHLEKVVLSWEELADNDVLVQVEEERRKALASPAFLRHQHRCYSCVVGFNHRCKLDDHNAKKHDPEPGPPALPREQSRRAAEVRAVREDVQEQGVAEDAPLHPQRGEGARVPQLREEVPLQEGDGDPRHLTPGLRPTLLLRVRHELQEPDVVQPAHEVQPQARRPRQAQARVLAVRQAVREGGAARGAQAGGAPEGDPHQLRGARLSVCVLFEARAPHARAHDSPQRARAPRPRVRRVRQGVRGACSDTLVLTHVPCVARTCA
ncbi:uncharacterized protein LOC112047770 isoform X11 [Bicyclus anynana]|uniref:Uncharacterized protein LOC112047770 isoform X11 n=1 Tax=Bicyclus anynana TaxID=110368 RepID=A0ABM3M3M1_BICAN|nr:uncharacterized protein LOC112047770 isoform X11 [Bicyclus anynana]